MENKVLRQSLRDRFSSKGQKAKKILEEMFGDDLKIFKSEFADRDMFADETGEFDLYQADVNGLVIHFSDGRTETSIARLTPHLCSTDSTDAAYDLYHILADPELFLDGALRIEYKGKAVEYDSEIDRNVPDNDKILKIMRFQRAQAAKEKRDHIIAQQGWRLPPVDPEVFRRWQEDFERAVADYDEIIIRAGFEPRSCPLEPL